MIRHISFYKDGKRNIVTPDEDGKFKVMEGKRTISSTPKPKMLTATDFVKHPSIRDFDPTITLDTGEKLRVYHAGNSFIPLVHPSLVLEKYDKKNKNDRKRTALQKKLDSMKKAKEGKERDGDTTQPMSSAPPIVPPYSGPVRIKKNVKVSSSPPQRKATDPSDPFANIIDEWFGDDDDLNDGLYPFGEEED